MAARLLDSSMQDLLRLKPDAQTTVQEVGNSSPSVETPDDIKARRVWRFWMLAFLFALLASLILARLLIYQVFDRNSIFYGTNWELSISPRGTIVDRDGEILAADRFYYHVIATPSEIKSDEARRFVSQHLETAIGLSAIATERFLAENATRHYLELAKWIDLQTGHELLDYIRTVQDAEGLTPLHHITVRAVPRRFYPQNSLASHLIGFVQAEHHGYYGLEEYYNTFLRTSGVGLLDRELATLDTLPAKVQRFLPSAAGKDLVLTVDRTVQYIIEQELQEALVKYRAESGSIIVMEPRTGAILGMANQPYYNPNHRGGDQVDFSLFPNSSISALYEPGSIFKVVTMAAGLDTNTITPTSVFTDTGYIVVGQRTIFNSNRGAAGRVTATDALAYSLNVVTAQVADLVGSEEFYRYIHRFGFAERTGVDLADEVPSLMKEPGDELWSESDLGTNSFGQGLAVTPLQMINSVAAIANDGTLLRPYVVQARVENERVLYTKPIVIRQAIAPETAAELTKMMIATVELGNKAARVNGYQIAGKSGTAQIPGPDGYLEDQTIVSFVGFAPAEDPAFVLLVKLDKPDPGISQWASYTAAPVFAKVARRLFEHLNIAPDAIRTQVAFQPAE